MQHAESHEALLARALAGEAVELGACEQCRVELERAREAARRARGVLELERAVLEDARRSTGDAERTLTRNLLARGRHRHDRARTRRTFVLLALACAAVLVAWLSLRRAPQAEPARREEVPLGGSLECLVEVREHHYHAFTWTPVELPEIRYDLRVMTLDSGQIGAEILARDGLTEARWEPTAEEERLLPDELHLEVRALDLFGVEQGSGWLRASRH